MKTRNEILTSVLNKMPDVFSTNDFCIRLRDEGFPEKEINDHVHLRFINKHCQNVLDSKRIYIKTKGNDNAAKEYKDQLTEIADVALDMMRDSFTVHEIIKEMRDLGMPERCFKNNYYFVFLKGKTKRIGRYSFQKITSQDYSPVQIIKEELNESECINYLKGLGYKIMRSVTNYEEV